MASELNSCQIARFQTLVPPHLALLVRTAQILTHDSHRADDLVQDTLWKAARAIEIFRDGSEIKAWLLTILRRTHIDQLRSHKFTSKELSLSGLETDPIDHHASVAETHAAQWQNPETLLQQFGDQDLIQALQQLPLDIMWTLLLVEVEQLDHATAAQILEIPVGTVKSRTARGRMMLRDRLYPLACERGWIRSPSPHVQESET